MKPMKKLVLAFSVLILSAAPVLASQTGTAASKTDAQMQKVAEKLAGGPGKMRQTASGKILVTATGHTLYTFDKDSNGVSACDAACLKKWPAYHASAKVKAVAPWSKVKATNGKDMWAYDGKPVYTFFKDKKPGDVNGDGVGGVWHIVK